MAPVLCFGLIADIQHADKDTVEFDGRPQRYTESRGKLQAALNAFSSSRQPQQPLQAVLTLGDIIDGYQGDPGKTTADLQLIAHDFDTQLTPNSTPVHHVLGNHCMAASRDELLKALHMPSSYYSVSLGHGWRLVVLDTTEVSLHSGYPSDSFQMQEAQAWLAAHPAEQFPNAQSWNGGCSSHQIAWLQDQLSQAAQAQEKVIVACHHPIAPGSAPAMYLAWDYERLLQMLTAAPGGVVKCVFSGHYHPGGYALHDGVHFVVFEGVLEAPADSNAYGVVEVWEDKLAIVSSGVATSRELVLSA